MKKQRKNEVGITLVALVITIIILLILAGVGITALTQTGLFEKAKEAKEITENAIENENSTLGKYENTINQLSSTRNNNQGIKIESLINKKDGLYNTTDNGYVFNTPTSYTSLNQNILLTTTIENYDYIIFEYDAFYISNASAPVKDYANPTTKIVSTEIIKNMYTKNFYWDYGKMIILNTEWGDNSNRISLGFKDSTSIKIWSSWSISTQLTKLRITDINGIKL